jgi:hypothetical protein
MVLALSCAAPLLVAFAAAAEGAIATTKRDALASVVCMQFENNLGGCCGINFHLTALFAWIPYHGCQIATDKSLTGLRQA